MSWPSSPWPSCACRLRYSMGQLTQQYHNRRQCHHHHSQNCISIANPAFGSLYVTKIQVFFCGENYRSRFFVPHRKLNLRFWFSQPLLGVKNPDYSGHSLWCVRRTDFFIIRIRKNVKSILMSIRHTRKFFVSQKIWNWIRRITRFFVSTSHTEYRIQTKRSQIFKYWKSPPQIVACFMLNTQYIFHSRSSCRSFTLHCAAAKTSAEYHHWQ